MTRYSQKESLRNALYYLQGLHLEFNDAIELKTLEIHRHKTRKGTLSLADSWKPDEARRMQAWRRISFKLHQRRSELKTMKETLIRQINDVEKALEQMEALYGLCRPYAMPMEPSILKSMGEDAA